MSRHPETSCSNCHAPTAKKNMRSDGGAGLRCKPGHGCAKDASETAPMAADTLRGTPHGTAKPAPKPKATPSAPAVRSKEEAKKAHDTAKARTAEVAKAADAPRDVAEIEAARSCRVCGCRAAKQCDTGTSTCSWMDDETPEAGDLCSACSQIIELAEERIEDAGGHIEPTLAAKVFEDVEMPCLGEDFEGAEARIAGCVAEARTRIAAARPIPPPGSTVRIGGSGPCAGRTGKVSKRKALVNFVYIDVDRAAEGKYNPLSAELLSLAEVQIVDSSEPPKGVRYVQTKATIGDLCEGCAALLTLENTSKLTGAEGLTHDGCPGKLPGPCDVCGAPRGHIGPNGPYYPHEVPEGPRLSPELRARFAELGIEPPAVLQVDCIDTSGGLNHCAAIPGGACFFATPEPASWAHACRFDRLPAEERAAAKRLGVEDRIRALVDSQAALPGNPPVPTVDGAVRALVVPGDCSAPELRERIEAMRARGELVALPVPAPGSGLYLRRTPNARPVVMGRVGVRAAEPTPVAAAKHSPTLEERIAAGERATVPVEMLRAPRIGQSEGGENDLMGRQMDPRHADGLGELEPKRAELEAALHDPDTAEGAAASLDVMGPPQAANASDVSPCHRGKGGIIGGKCDVCKTIDAAPAVEICEHCHDPVIDCVCDTGRAARSLDFEDDDRDVVASGDDRIAAHLRAAGDAIGEARRAFEQHRGSPSELSELRAQLDAEKDRRRASEDSLAKHIVSLNTELDVARTERDAAKRDLEQERQVADDARTARAERAEAEAAQAKAIDELRAAEAERDAAREGRDAVEAIAQEQAKRDAELVQRWQDRSRADTAGRTVLRKGTARAIDVLTRAKDDPANEGRDDVELAAELERVAWESLKGVDVYRARLIPIIVARFGVEAASLDGLADAFLFDRLDELLGALLEQPKATEGPSVEATSHIRKLAWLDAIGRLGGETPATWLSEQITEEQAWKALFNHVWGLQERERDCVRFDVLAKLGRAPVQGIESEQLKRDLDAAIAALLERRRAPRMPVIELPDEHPLAPPQNGAADIKDLF